MKNVRPVVSSLFVFLGWIVIMMPCAAQEQHLRAPAQPIPKTLFGLHMHRADTTTPWPSVPFGVLRLWDSGTTWADLAPQRGKWDFAKLDKLVSLAEQHGVEVELPLGTPPAWASARPTEGPTFRPGSAAEPRNMQDWNDYVRTLATRYKGRIHLWEVWNEPNMKDFYTGGIPQMVELEKTAFQILKQVDPGNRLASPSAMGDIGVSWQQQFLAAGGGRYADVIGHHFYVSGGPEAMIPMVLQLRRTMSKNGVEQKTIWNTETGWFIHSDKVEVKAQGSFKVVASEDAAAYVPRAYALLWALGVTRFNWYDWDSTTMALAEPDGTPKPAAVAYATTQKWLVGALMKSCDSDQSGTWVCQITRDGGYNGYLVWNPQRKIDFRVPDTWSVQNERDFSGGTHSVKAASSVSIGIAPILLENKLP